MLDRGFVPKFPLTFSTSDRVATDRVSQPGRNKIVFKVSVN